MFIVFNKEKIYSYIITLLMVIILFSGVSIFANNNKTIQTSASVSKLLPIYSVDTKEKNVALTLNCAWSQIPMG